MTARGLFVTGTDTGIGKTWASCVLLHALRQRGLRATGMKPVSSGCRDTLEGLRNADAEALIDASEPQPAYADCNPFAFAEPIAPHLAAAMQVQARGIGATLDIVSTMQIEPVDGGKARLLWKASVVKLSGLVATISKPLIQGAAGQVAAITWEKVRKRVEA
jgi:dethiobiotin synthetase